jgi:N-carbamoyl-L-amino-acid hydrolase
MESRHDALRGAARMVEAVNAVALKHAPDGRATVGFMQVKPNSRNVIPGQVAMSIDVRHPSDDALATMDRELRDAASTIARDVRLECEMKQVVAFPASHFHPDCVSSVQRAAEMLGLSSRRIVSGAAHDAVYLSRVAPTAMIFVPCKDGISHNEIESARPEHLEAGANVLLLAVLERAGVASSHAAARR